MSQFSLYQNKDKGTNKTYPYFVDVQSDLLRDLNSRLVIPLTPSKKINEKVAQKLCPAVLIDGEEFVLLANQMTTVPKSILRADVGTLAHYRDEIVSSIDMLISGI